ncbi:ENTH/ANTH/VHS superfamily protein [Wolffia australiana]
MGTMEGWRKAYGAIKDSTKVGLAKINSEFKDLDVAVLKATNHVECPPKERHLRKIFVATSAVRPRADVAYCIHALARRLAKTRNWTVALKVLIVIHRTLREGDPTFREELLNYARRGHILHISNFKDDSSALAWDCSAWVRAYALFLEERLECFRVLHYDIEAERLSKSPKGHSRTRTLACDDLLEQLPALQQLLFRLTACQPEGTAFLNYLIQYALALVLKESFKIYCAINDGIINLVDLFFDMSKHDAVKALSIYKRARQQAESLSEFYEICKGLELARSFNFPLLREPPPSFLTTMEEYIREAPRDGSPSNLVKEIPEITLGNGKHEDELPEEVGEKNSSPIVEDEKGEVEESNKPEEKENSDQLPETQTGDLLGLDEVNPDAAELDATNALALYLTSGVGEGEGPKASAVGQHMNGRTGWEVALVAAPSNNRSHVTETQLAGGFDMLLLDSLYEDAAFRREQTHRGYGPPPAEAANPFVVADPFAISSSIAPPPAVQMEIMKQQQQRMQQQQQQQQHQQFMCPMLPGNPFGDPFPSFSTSIPGSHPSLL